MFDDYSFKLFERLPVLDELNIDECRRNLSKAYMYSIKMRLELIQDKYISIDIKSLSDEELDQIEEEIKEDHPSSDFNQLYSELRRLGDTLESSAIFDDKSNDETLKASSFVAAESLSLLSTLLSRNMEIDENNNLLFSNEMIYTRVEAAMLYLIAGYDANAFTEINEISKGIKDYNLIDNDNDLLKIEYWFLMNIISFCSNQLWRIDRKQPKFSNPNKSKSLKNLIIENKYTMYSMLGDSLIFYIDWLIGEKVDGKTKSLEILQKINQISYQNRFSLYPEIFHLSKVLMVMVTVTSNRSLFHNIPVPKDNKKDFLIYLKRRTEGNVYLNSRPFIWESAKEFVGDCLPGPNKHSIINLPTGSGKSFIAELAVAQSLSNGWVLYLAPTNALVHQIRRDLKNSLSSFDGLEIRTFVGGDEYTTLENEFLNQRSDSNKFVAVMTPEKCAMSLRLNPTVFESCSLCVFDECHLLGEGLRGVTVDLVLGQILSLNEQVKLMLMSAILSNPNDLLEWLNNATSNITKISSISWKPTRSVRGAVGVENNSYIKKRRIAEENLETKPEKRKNEKFTSKLSIFYSLSGIWNTNYNDYSLMELDTEVKFKVHRKQIGNHWVYKSNPVSWVNNVSSTLGIELAAKGIPTIVFITSNRHYPFSLARNLNLGSQLPKLGDVENSFLLLAEKELGVESEVKKILKDNGIGVHTAFMLDTEKEAVERIFLSQEIKLLFATGTLAQGLNLPSVAVIIAGTRIGDRRFADTPEALNRSKALILNAIGRAGRAGFSNQSLSLIVPDNPIFYNHDKRDLTTTIGKLEVLKDKDASIKVRSPLEDFLDNIINDAIQPERASLQELTIMSMLTSSGNEVEETSKTKEILKKTYAGFAIKQKANEGKLEKASLSISKIKNEFIKNAKAPEYAITIARKSGFDFFTANIFIKIVDRHIKGFNEQTIKQWTIREWKQFLITSLKDVPPFYLRGLFPETISQKPTLLNKMLLSLRGELVRDLHWNKPAEWDRYWDEFSDILDLFMGGQSLAKIAQKLLGISGEVEFSRSGGKPLPDVLAFIKNQVETISSFAGLLVAILEEIVYKDQELPFNLNALPLAIKNGLKDHSSFYWYNYTFRNRIVAHTLASLLPLGEFSNSEELIRRVIKLRKSWLAGKIIFENISENDRDILNAAKTIIENS